MQTETTFERLQSLLPEVFSSKRQTGELYLRFCLSSSLYAAVPLTRIVETLRLSTISITPIPNMPAYTLGLMGNRSQVFWVLDLAQRLNLTQGNKRIRHHNVVVVGLPDITHQNPNSLLLGLSVQQIQTTLRLHPEEVNFEADDIVPELQPYCQGWFKHQGEQTFLLNVDALVSTD
ncbi:chemotaxis protein CheW [Leptolyngbya cf. ectocarpi LEGE 11479]|uniref:Chemotaxis protein CheW n=1 Tax=Leptolyngbya cf. ectocarpi LEGE 11479 TaxID=1828722 RepID=A0A928WXJ0_LEPEC|nr:chemotaxis protein CheW [Leptolyngbya ectocarpi]MBE9065280.1 chemotaxis protein CheW [Leptolyngbya cf. ectocarpi LEGE 11479]